MLALLVASNCVAPPQETKAVPTTCDTAVATVMDEMNKNDLAEVRTTAFVNLIQYHHGLGTSIRNAFGLWAGNVALAQDCNRILNNTVEPGHPDTVSTLIIQHLWKTLNEKQ